MTQAAPNRGVALQLTGVTKHFGQLTANDDISFALNEGEVLALLGENGAGKTTLMNILFGHYTADGGTVEVFGSKLAPGAPGAALAAGVGMVHQHFTLAENMTVLENVLLGTVPLWRANISMKQGKQRLETIANDFGLSIDADAPIKSLSVGERQRVEILKALYRQARILILDEPTAVLTPQESDALFETLRAAVDKGLSVIFISHKLHEVMDLSDRIVVLRHGRLVGEVPTSETDRHELAEMMVGSEITAPKAQPQTPGAVQLKLIDVSTSVEGRRVGLSAANLSLNAGQITGIAGVSGNGQGALADLISGLADVTSGAMEVMGAPIKDWSPKRALQSGIGRIPEDRHAAGSIADFTLTENVILEAYDDHPISRRGWLHWNKSRERTEEIIERYDVRCPGPETTIRLLSGGNMQKLILGRVFESEPQILLANQPVRGLDIGALTYVHERLLKARQDGVAILLISEDLDEILALSDVIHVMSEGRISPPFARGSKTPTELGVWMAGQGFEDAA